MVKQIGTVSFKQTEIVDNGFLVDPTQATVCTKLYWSFCIAAKRLDDMIIFYYILNKQTLLMKAIWNQFALFVLQLEHPLHQQNI